MGIIFSVNLSRLLFLQKMSSEPCLNLSEWSIAHQFLVRTELKLLITNTFYGCYNIHCKINTHPRTGYTHLKYSKTSTSYNILGKTGGTIEYVGARLYKCVYIPYSQSPYSNYNKVIIKLNQYPMDMPYYSINEHLEEHTAKRENTYPKHKDSKYGDQTSNLKGMMWPARRKNMTSNKVSQ